MDNVERVWAEIKDFLCSEKTVDLTEEQLNELLTLDHVLAGIARDMNNDQ